MKLGLQAVEDEVEIEIKMKLKIKLKMKLNLKLRMKLLTGILPVNNSLLTGTVKNLVFLQNLSSDMWPRLVRPLEC